MNFQLRFLKKESRTIERAIEVISRMNINNKVEVLITLTRVMAVKDMEVQTLEDQLKSKTPTK